MSVSDPSSKHAQVSPDPEVVDVGFLVAQQRVLEMAARGAAIDTILDAIVGLVEDQSADMTCSILLVDQARRVMVHGGAQKLPLAYRQAIDGAPVGPDAGSCGAAAFLGQVVEVEDIATHKNWDLYRDIALPHGLRACWSTPIFASRGEVLGTFAMYYDAPRLPTARERGWVAAATHLAAIVIEQDQARRALASNEAELRAMFENASIGLALGTPELPGVRANPALCQFLGYSRDELRVIEPAVLTHPADIERDLGLFMELVAGTRDRYTIEKRYIRKDGSVVWGRLSATATRDPATGRLAMAIGMVEDITAHKRLESQMLHAQRIDSLARLAGGFAHDFNNILTAITGFAEVAADALAPGHAAAQALVEVGEAAHRATDLVQKILAFSRDVEPRRSAQSLAPIVREAARLLRATLPNTIDVRVDVAAERALVRADATQIHQILMNLGTNAWHAMADGGELVLSVDERLVGPGVSEGGHSLAPGRWVRLAVRDSGIGMDAATREHLFEPFFTTRGPGRGAGLGLAMVMAIAKAHDGHVRVQSEPGRGSTFEVWLPVVDGPTRDTATAAPLGDGRGERVLFVDDEPAIGRLVQRELERAGFAATVFDDPTRALAAFQAAPNDFEVVVSDVSMPRLSGFDLAREVRRLRPDVTFVIISGGLWNRDAIEVRGLDIGEFLLKPQALKQLAATLRRLLDGRKEITLATSQNTSAR